MVATNGRIVTVFGGTGFLGRHIVGRLRSSGFPVRIASRNPNRGRQLFGPDDPQLQSVGADIHDKRSVEDALSGAYGVVNAVSLYVERGQETFQSVHVEAAQQIAVQSHRAGLARLVHVSGNRCRCCITIPLHPKARRRRAGSPGRVRGCSFRSPGCDVRTGRRISHYHPEAASAAPNLSNVRPRSDQIATGLCGRCSRSGCSN